MSDTATIESSTEAESDGAEAAAPSELGSGMAHRARSQSVLGRHWSPSGVVGAVGRASVGFGLAVGRSRSIRPTVRFDDLNSAALRPSFDVWRRQRSRDGEVDDGRAGEMTPVVRGASIEHRPTVRTPDAAVRTPDAAVRRSTERLRRHPQRRPRPTWTDQIIQRSSIGFVASAPKHGVPVSPLPSDFVPSGDAKLDQLRLLMRQREGGVDRVTAAAAADRATSPTGPSAPDAGAYQTVLRRTTAAEPTVSVVADGPGRLARALRPESALAPTVPQARLGESPAPAGSASRSPDGRPVTSVAQRSAAPGRRATRSTRSAEPPSRLEQLRAALIQQGLLTDGPDDGGGESPAGNDDVSPRIDDRSDTSRSSSTVADLQRAVATEGPRPTRSAPARTGGSAPPAAPDAGLRPRPSTARADLSSQESGSVASLDTTTFAGSGERESGVGAVALAERTTATALAEQAFPPAPDTARTVTANPGDSPAAPSSLASAAPVTSRPAHQLRAQRLLRSGLAAEPSFSNDADAVTEFADAPSGQRGGVGVVPTNTAIDRVVAATVPRVTTRPAHGISVDQPTLTRVDSSPATVVRRVTLPRALSSTHRPASQLPVSHVRTVSDTVRAPARVSAVSLGEAQSATHSAARSSTQSVMSVGANAMGVTGDASTAPGSAVVAPARTGALLDVVRRFAVADRAVTRTSLPLTATAAPPVVQRSSERTASLQSAPFTDVEGRPAGSLVSDESPVDERRERRLAVDQDSAEVMRPVRPAERVAEQFMTALSETVRRRPAPLPTTYRPLADAIAGPRPVMLSTDTASRKALRSVGKVAATTGDTIHLDPQAVSSARLDEVMAHELTHIAHSSPVPRFFDDLDDSPEERRAEQVAKLMSRSPLAPSATTSAPPALRRRDDATIRRSPASAPQPASSGGTVSAQALASSLTRNRSSGTSNVVQRWESAAPSRSSSSSSSKQAPQIGSHRSASTSGSSTSATTESKSEPAPSAEWFREQLAANLDHVVKLLEDRMIVELERRGGRAWRQS